MVCHGTTFPVNLILKMLQKSPFVRAIIIIAFYDYIRSINHSYPISIMFGNAKYLKTIFSRVSINKNTRHTLTDIPERTSKTFND